MMAQACASCKELWQLGSDAPQLKGAPVRAFELKADGLAVQCMSYGCYITGIHAPDREGIWKDVAVGFDVPNDIVGYVDGRSQYYGSVVGRFANRLAGGKFELDGMGIVQLPSPNNGPNTLHGGTVGWDQRHWEVTGHGVLAEAGAAYVDFKYISEDGEEGFPSEVHAAVRYTVSGSTLRIEYTAKNTGDKPTVLNITNHTYFNLTGDLSRNILGHHLRMSCQKFTPVDSAEAIPTGKNMSVTGTPFDFTGEGRPLGQLIDMEDEQLKFAGGYDHNFVLPLATDGADGQLQFCAELSDPVSGRRMECHTTEPGVQLYTGNFMSASRGNGKAGVCLGYRTGVCLETQHFPDSPNQASFPSTRLEPGKTYESATEYRFSVVAT